MELTTKVTLDMLTCESVSVLEQQFLNNNGSIMQVGVNIRTAYMNSTSGRNAIKTALPSNYYNAVLAVWGENPIVTESAE